MSFFDLHVHTNFCDGKNSPEEMVEQAYSIGMDKIGILCHSYTFFDESYCIKKERIPEFHAEVKGLKEKYKDKIEVLLGVEQDSYSTHPTDGCDYVIGSVHYIKVGQEYLSIDESHDKFVDIANKYFGGDFYSLCEAYYETATGIIDRTKADIIGHFDLIAKYNEKFGDFDENHPRYIAAWQKAADSLLAQNAVFEINTGALARGHRSVPYPKPEISDYIISHGGKVLLSGDCHQKEKLGYRLRF